MARKTISAEWANSAAPSEIVAPTATKQNNGWTAEKPPYQNFNWAWQIFTNMLQNAEQNGIMEWSTDTTYPQYGLALGSDGKVYQSQVASNQGNDPTVDIGTNWLEWLADGVEYSAGANGYLKLPTWLGGFIVQWGTFNLTSGEGAQGPISFNVPFVTACYNIGVSSIRPTTDASGDWFLQITSYNSTQFSIYKQSVNHNPTTSDKCSWFAVGK